MNNQNQIVGQEPRNRRKWILLSLIALIIFIGAVWAGQAYFGNGSQTAAVGDLFSNSNDIASSTATTTQSGGNNATSSSKRSSSSLGGNSGTKSGPIPGAGTACPVGWFCPVPVGGGGGGFGGFGGGSTPTPGSTSTTTATTTATTTPTSGPYASFVEPTNSQIISYSVALVGTFGDTSSSTVSAVNFYVDGVALGADVSVSGATSTRKVLDTTTLTNGSHTLTFSATNTASVATSTSIVVNVSNGSSVNTAFDEGMVSLDFDDGWSSTYDSLFTADSLLGLKTTQYIISQYMVQSAPYYMDTAHVTALKNAGHEIQSHTQTHADLSTLSASDLYNEVALSKSDLESNGLGIQSVLAYPYGVWNNDIITSVKNAGYLGARTALPVDGGYNYRDGNPFLIKTQSIDSDMSVANIEAMIDQAKANKTWLVLVLHNPEQNLLANSSMQTASSIAIGNPDCPGPEQVWREIGDPSGWLRGCQWGDNVSVYEYLTTGHDDNTSVKVSITSCTIDGNTGKCDTGDEKWYFDDVTVVPNTSYTFSDFYISDVDSDLWARYKHNDGSFTYEHLVTLTSSATWKQASTIINVPNDTTIASITVLHSIKSVGSLNIDDASLTHGGQYSISTGNLTAIANYIKNNNVKVVTASEGVYSMTHK